MEPIIFGFGLQRHDEGYPLGGYWARPITGFDDANGDGIIAAGRGHGGRRARSSAGARPAQQGGRRSTASSALFDGQVRVGTQFDYRGGHYIDNAIESFRCTPVLNCRGLVDRTAPLEEQARAQALLNEATEWGYYEPGLVHQAAGALPDLLRPRRLGPQLPGQPAEPHAGGAEPLDHHRLHRGGPGGERLRPGQLRDQRLRVPAAGALLDRAPQHRLLRRGDETMRRIVNPSRRPAPAWPLAGCGLLDTDQPNIVEPGDVETPAGAAGPPGRRHRRLRLRPGRRRDPVRGRAHPAERPHVATSSCSPPRRRPSRRSTSGGCSSINSTPVRRVPQPAPGPRRGRDRGAGALREFCVDPDGRRPASPRC